MFSNGVLVSGRYRHGKPEKARKHAVSGTT